MLLYLFIIIIIYMSLFVYCNSCILCVYVCIYIYIYIYIYMCNYMYIYIYVCIYIFDLYLSVFLRSTVSVICMHQGSESNAISILCMYSMYGTCGRIDNKADFDFDLTLTESV